MPFGCLPLILFLGFLFLLPVFFADLMLTAMAKLGFSPGASLMLVIGIFMGGLINIPIKRIARDDKREDVIDIHPPGYLGMDRLFPRIRSQPFTLIAVNVGGCVIPCLMVLYELSILSAYGPQTLALTGLCVAVNIYLCHRFARPIPNVGIGLPALVPALAAVLCAWIFLPDIAPPAAFVAGVLGPVIGADILHLKDIQSLKTGIGSIGGAGTFDGIVLSGLFATLLA